MTRLLQLIGDAPESEFKPGELLIEQGSHVGSLYILKEGEVEIRRDNTPICKISKVGSTFGEISALLGIKATASVIAVRPSKLVVIEDSVSFLSRHVEVALEIARILAHRVNWLTHRYSEEMDDDDSLFWRYRG